MNATIANATTIATTPIGTTIIHTGPNGRDMEWKRTEAGWVYLTGYDDGKWTTERIMAVIG